MEIHDIASSVVKVGLCEYESKKYRVFICLSDVFPGTGDYEDEKETREDRNIACYCVWFENYAEQGSICSGGGYFLSLQEATDYTETSPGFKCWLD